MVMHCDNELAIKLTKNLVYHKRTKHMKLDYHFIREKIEANDVVFSLMNMSNQVADFLSKAVSKNQLRNVFSELGIINIYVPA